MSAHISEKFNLTNAYQSSQKSIGRAQHGSQINERASLHHSKPPKKRQSQPINRQNQSSSSEKPTAKQRKYSKKSKFRAKQREARAKNRASKYIPRLCFARNSRHETRHPAQAQAIFYTPPQTSKTRHQNKPLLPILSFQASQKHNLVGFKRKLSIYSNIHSPF